MNRTYDYEGVSIFEGRIEDEAIEHLVFNYRESDDSKPIGPVETQATSNANLALSARSHRQFLVKDNDNFVWVSLIPTLHIKDGSSEGTPQITLSLQHDPANNKQTKADILSALLNASRASGYDGSLMDVSTTVKLFGHLSNLEHVIESATDQLRMAKKYTIFDNQNPSHCEHIDQGIVRNISVHPIVAGSLLRPPTDHISLQFSDHCINLLDNDGRLACSVFCVLAQTRESTWTLNTAAYSASGNCRSFLEVMNGDDVREALLEKANNLHAVGREFWRQTKRDAKSPTSRIIEPKDVDPCNPASESIDDEEIDERGPIGLPMSTMTGILDVLLHQHGALVRTKLSQLCESGVQDENGVEKVSAEVFAPYRDWSVVLTTTTKPLSLETMDHEDGDIHSEELTLPYVEVKRFEPSV